MQNVAFAVAHGPEPLLAIVAAGVRQIMTGPSKIRAPSSKPMPRPRSVLACLAPSHSNFT